MSKRVTFVDSEADVGDSGGEDEDERLLELTLRDAVEQQEMFVDGVDSEEESGGQADLDWQRATSDDDALRSRMAQYESHMRRKRVVPQDDDEEDVDGRIASRSLPKRRRVDVQEKEIWDEEIEDEEDVDESGDWANRGGGGNDSAGQVDFSAFNRAFEKMEDPVKKRLEAKRREERERRGAHEERIVSQSSRIVRKEVRRVQKERPVDLFENADDVLEEVDDMGRRIIRVEAPQQNVLVHDPYNKQAQQAKRPRGLVNNALRVVRNSDIAQQFRTWRNAVAEIESQLPWPDKFETPDDFAMMAEGVGDMVSIIGEMEAEEVRTELTSLLMRFGGDQILSSKMSMKQVCFIASTTFPPVEVSTVYAVDATEQFYINRYTLMITRALKIVPNARYDDSLSRTCDLLINRIKLIARTMRAAVLTQETFYRHYNWHVSPLSRLQFFALGESMMDMGKEQAAMHAIQARLADYGYRHRGALLFKLAIRNGVDIHYYEPVYDEPKVQMTIERFIKRMLSAHSRGSTEWLLVSGAIGKFRSIAALLEGMDHISCPRLLPSRTTFAFANGIWDAQKAEFIPHEAYVGPPACRYLPMECKIPGSSLAHMEFFGASGRDPRFAPGEEVVYPIPKTRIVRGADGVEREEPFECEETLPKHLLMPRTHRPAYAQSSSVRDQCTDEQELKWLRNFLGDDLCREEEQRREVADCLAAAGLADEDDDEEAVGGGGGGVEIKDYDSDDDDDMHPVVPPGAAAEIDSELRNYMAEAPQEMSPERVPVFAFEQMTRTSEYDPAWIHERARVYIEEHIQSEDEEEEDEERRDALLDWMNIPTPVIDRVLMTQYVDPQEVRAQSDTAGGATRVKNARVLMRFIYAFLGRALYELLEHDAWSKSLFISGEGGTGKSLIADALMYIYPAAFTATMSAQSEKGFGLEALMKAWLVIADEMRKGTSIGVTDILKMIEAGRLQVRMKNKVAQDVDWTALLFMFGNDLAEVWRESRNSLNRRLLILIFNVIVSEGKKDERLREHMLKYELGSFIIKITVAYRSLVRYMREKRVHNIEAIYHSYFKEQSEKFLAENNYLYAFLKSSDVELRKNSPAHRCYVPLAVFQWAMKKWCERQGKFYRWLGDAQSNRPFQMLGVGYVANSAGDKDMACRVPWPNIGCDYKYENPGEYLANVDLKPHVVQAYFDDPSNHAHRADRGDIERAFHGGGDQMPRGYAAPGMEARRREEPNRVAPPAPPAPQAPPAPEAPPAPQAAVRVFEIPDEDEDEDAVAFEEAALQHELLEEVNLVLQPDFEENMQKGTYVLPSDEEMAEMREGIKTAHRKGHPPTASLETLLDTINNGVNMEKLVKKNVFEWKTTKLQFLSEVVYETAVRAHTMLKLKPSGDAPQKSRKELRMEKAQRAALRTALREVITQITDNFPKADPPSDEDEAAHDNTGRPNVTPAYDAEFGDEGL